MKQKDIALILVVVIFASFFSVLASKFLFASNEDKKLEAQVVQPITTDFQAPDSSVFNDQAINPTQLIQIGNSNNNEPF